MLRVREGFAWEIYENRNDRNASAPIERNVGENNDAKVQNLVQMYDTHTHTHTHTRDSNIKPKGRKVWSKWNLLEAKW